MRKPKVIIVAGPPACGKTSVMVHSIKSLQRLGIKTAVSKIDCLATEDDQRYAGIDVPVVVGLSGDICPDHYLEIKSGQIYSIVGFTGSGKSQLISDIEQMAQRDTITERKILVNGQSPDYTTRYDPDVKLVAHLSQNMNFTLEMGVKDFLYLHGECRGINMSELLIGEVMEYTNTLAGEPVKEDDILTRLSVVKQWIY